MSTQVCTVHVLRHVPKKTPRRSYNTPRQVRQLNTRKMEELDGINARVRATVTKKDEIILVLQQQVRETEGRVEQYEELLDRQRKELLS